MGPGRRGELSEWPTTCQYPLRVMRMEAHLFLLCPGERPAMFPRAIGDGGALVVVPIPPPAYQADVLAVKSHLHLLSVLQPGLPAAGTWVLRRIELTDS